MLQLLGDSSEFDDRHFVVTQPVVAYDLVCIDLDNRPSNESFGFFPQKVPLNDRDRRVQFVWRTPDNQAPWIGPEVSPLLLASASCSLRDAQQIQHSSSKADMSSTAWTRVSAMRQWGRESWNRFGRWWECKRSATFGKLIQDAMS